MNIQGTVTVSSLLRNSIIQDYPLQTKVNLSSSSISYWNVEDKNSESGKFSCREVKESEDWNAVCFKKSSDSLINVREALLKVQKKNPDAIVLSAHYSSCYLNNVVDLELKISPKESNRFFVPVRMSKATYVNIQEESCD